MGIFNRIKNIAKSRNAKDLPPSNDLYDLKTGDIVSIDYVDYIVDAVINYKDGHWTWLEYKLVDGSDVRWLSVEMDDTLLLSLYSDIIPFTTEAFKKTEYKNKTYFLLEGSDGVVGEVKGNISLERGLKFDYFDYATEDGKDLLAVEIYGGSVEMSVGTRLEAFQIKVYKKNLEG